MAEGVAVEFDAHGFGFVCVELDLDEALELAGGAQHTFGGAGHVQLGDGGAGHVGIVGHGEPDAGFVGGQVTVGEGRVAQAVAEREADGHVGGFVVAVADERALAVDGVTANGRVPAGGRAVDVTDRPGFGQVTGWVDLAGQGAHGGGCARLAGQADVQDCGHGVEPWQLDRRAGHEHDDDGLAGGGQGVDQIVLHLRDRHGGAVEALGFAALVEADDGDYCISGVGGGERFGFVDERLVLGSLAVVALRVAGHGHAGGCCGVLELIKDVLFASGIHLGRAGALESRGFGHVADYGDASAGL